MRSIDIVVPTYQRPDMLLRTLESLESAERPANLRVRAIIVDNNSKDDTETVVRNFAAGASIPIEYVFEARAGRSAAANAGVARSDAEYIGFIDDDQRLFPEWFRAVEEAIRTLNPDYLGGPVVPDVKEGLPPWMPNDWPGVIGDSSGEKQRFEYGRRSGSFFPGGNGVIRRQLFIDIGMYHPALGRAGQQRLMSCEDRDLFDRLLDHAAVGYFIPELKVWHHVPPERLTQAYFRLWAFDHGASLSVYTRLRKVRSERSLLGVELWIWRATVMHASRWLRRRLLGGGDPANVFSSELHVREFAGRLRGLTFPLPDEAA